MDSLWKSVLKPMADCKQDRRKHCVFVRLGKEIAAWLNVSGEIFPYHSDNKSHYTDHFSFWMDCSVSSVDGLLLYYSLKLSGPFPTATDLPFSLTATAKCSSNLSGLLFYPLLWILFLFPLITENASGSCCSCCSQAMKEVSQQRCEGQCVSLALWCGHLALLAPGWCEAALRGSSCKNAKSPFPKPPSPVIHRSSYRMS